MSMLYADMLRSGPLRGKIPQRTMEKLAKRYWNRPAPPSSDRVFLNMREKYRARFGRDLPPIRQLPKMTPRMFENTRPPSPSAMALSMRGATPLARAMVDPGSIAGAYAFPQVTTTQTGQNAAQPALSYVSNFKKEWVDDRGWTGGMKTLPEIIGSGMLSAQALTNLQIGNILSLFDFHGGTEQERLEVGYLLQRFIMDGYIRGVDVYKYIQDTNAADGSRIVIGLINEEERAKLINIGVYAIANSGNGQAIGLNPNANYVLMNQNWFRDQQDDAHKLGVFYHEMGHQIGLPHAGDGGYNPSGEYGNFMGDTTPTQNPPWKTESEMLKHHGDQLIDSLFRDAGTRGGTMGAPLRKFDPASDDAPPPTSAPPGFPQVGGTDQNNIGVNFRENIEYQVSPTQVNPHSPEPMSLAGQGPQVLDPESTDKTPTAGMLPGMPQLSSFAAGLNDVMSKATPLLGQLAGSIQKRKT